MPHKNIPGIVAAFQTLLLFIMGILGGKISEGLEIKPVFLVILTGIGLTAMALISYLNSTKTETAPDSNKHPVKGAAEDDPKNAAKLKRIFYRFFPKTMLGIFPLGIVLGFLSGVIFPFIIEKTSLHITIPFWQYVPFSMPLSDSEALGIYFGLGSSIVCAIFLDGYLGAALAIGYGFAFPVTLITVETHIEGATVFAHILGFTLFGVLLIIITPLITKIKPIIRKYLTQIGKSLTQKRI
jgi:hypothetical protein